MSRVWSVIRSFAVLAALHAGCGDETNPSNGGGAGSAGAASSGANGGAPPGGTGGGGAGGTAASACTLPSDCRDLEVPPLSTKACCSAKVACGLELPEADAETLALFPMITDFVASVTGDPNSRCAPQSFFFAPRPGLDKQLVETETGEDIYITPDCESFTLAAFILPGCCLANSTCGLSTNESWTTLGALATGVSAPFAMPECVSAEVLNQQFRDSVVLEGFARTTASGSCNHAALVAELGTGMDPDADAGASH